MSSADTTPRSWSRQAAGRAGEATEGSLDRGRQGNPAGPNGHPSRSGRPCHPKGRSAIEEAQKFAADRGDEWITIDAREIGDEDQMFTLTAIGFLPHPSRPDRLRAHPDPVEAAITPRGLAAQR